MAALLAAVAVIAIAPTLMTGSGTHAQALAGAAGSGLAATVAGTLIRKASRDEDAWPSGVGIAWAMFLIAAVSFAYLAVGSTSDTANHPRPADALLLLLLIPLTIAMRDELRVHFDAADRREIAIDVMHAAIGAGVLSHPLTPSAYIEPQFVHVMQKRQGAFIACLEEIAYKQGWIDRASPVALVGDHPNDIRAARAHGVRAIAVATGLAGADELAAHSPDVLVPDMRALSIEMLLG